MVAIPNGSNKSIQILKECKKLQWNKICVLMTICWVPVQTLLRHALWMIKDSVCIENDSPQEACQKINKQNSTDPVFMQFGPFDSLTGLP